MGAEVIRAASVDPHERNHVPFDSSVFPRAWVLGSRRLSFRRAVLWPTQVRGMFHLERSMNLEFKALSISTTEEGYISIEQDDYPEAPALIEVTPEQVPALVKALRMAAAEINARESV